MRRPHVSCEQRQVSGGGHLARVHHRPASRAQQERLAELRVRVQVVAPVAHHTDGDPSARGHLGQQHAQDERVSRSSRQRGRQQQPPGPGRVVGRGPRSVAHERGQGHQLLERIGARRAGQRRRQPFHGLVGRDRVHGSEGARQGQRKLRVRGVGAGGVKGERQRLEHRRSSDAAVELDDQLLVHGRLDLVAVRVAHHPADERLLVHEQPRRGTRSVSSDASRAATRTLLPPPIATTSSVRSRRDGMSQRRPFTSTCPWTTNWRAWARVAAKPSRTTALSSRSSSSWSRRSPVSASTVPWASRT